MLPELFNITV